MFYDPKKEAREKRRKELYPDSSSPVDGATSEYVPGESIRGSMSANRRYDSGDKKTTAIRRLVILLIVMLILAFIIFM